MWLTTADETLKLAPRPAPQSAGAAKGDEAVTIDTSKHFQKMQGFGAAMKAALEAAYRAGLAAAKEER